MDTTLSTNILFYTLSILGILSIVFLAIMLAYAILVFRKLRDIFIIIKREAEKIENDIDAVRGKVKGGGAFVTTFLMHIVSFFKGKIKKSKK